MTRNFVRLTILALSAVSLLPGQMTHSAKVALEDGTPLPVVPQIIPENTSRLVPGCFIVNIFGNGTVVYAINWRSRNWDPKTQDECVVTIRLSGYRQMTATLRDGAVIVLKRVGDHEGSTVSMTTLKAPENARKAYEKGVAALGEKKWPAAQKNFEKAVELYPDYAQAWCDLAEALKEQGKPDEARTAAERALKADPKYLRPYLQLARLALADKKLEEAVRITDQGIEQNPLEFPGIFFYNAVANYNLKQLDAAEKSARRTIELDSNHEIPRAEFLLGAILASKGDRAGAVEHMKKYLALTPKADDAANVKQMIAKLEAAPTEQK